MGRYDMGAATLTGLRRQTGSSSQDLGSLVKKLIDDAEPLEGKFNGAGKAAFDGFKARADQISCALNGALASILSGQGGMDAAFQSGEQDMVASTNSVEGAADFDAARFGAR
jgi:uncharacterized protein YukE